MGRAWTTKQAVGDLSRSLQSFENTVIIAKIKCILSKEETSTDIAFSSGLHHFQEFQSVAIGKKQTNLSPKYRKLAQHRKHYFIEMTHTARKW